MIDYETEKRIKIPKEVSAGAAITLTFINQIFAFIGGTQSFNTFFTFPFILELE